MRKHPTRRKRKSLPQRPTKIKTWRIIRGKKKDGMMVLIGRHRNGIGNHPGLEVPEEEHTSFLVGGIPDGGTIAAHTTPTVGEGDPMVATDSMEEVEVMVAVKTEKVGVIIDRRNSTLICCRRATMICRLSGSLGRRNHIDCCRTRGVCSCTLHTHKDRIWS